MVRDGDVRPARRALVREASAVRAVQITSKNSHVGAVNGCRARQCDVALALLVDELMLAVPRSAVRMAGAPSIADLTEDGRAQLEAARGLLIRPQTAVH
jgi:hypothetical protein